MSTWVVCPSKRPLAEVEPWAAKWHAQGYKIALWRDPGEVIEACDAVITGRYQGYAKAVNDLVRFVLNNDLACQWVVIAADDIEPDAAHTADEIAQQCSDHFRCDIRTPYLESLGTNVAATWGVMQPTGDRYGANERHLGEPGSAYIDRVAGSPWVGREFAQRVNGGNGPLWPEYTHMFVDEELQCVAVNLGIFWQRPDLIQLHNHWARKRQDADDMPEFLREANSSEHWRTYHALFCARKAAGFPGHEPK